MICYLTGIFIITSIRRSQNIWAVFISISLQVCELLWSLVQRKSCQSPLSFHIPVHTPAQHVLPLLKALSRNTFNIWITGYLEDLWGQIRFHPGYPSEWTTSAPASFMQDSPSPLHYSWLILLSFSVCIILMVWFSLNLAEARLVDVSTRSSISCDHADYTMRTARSMAFKNFFWTLFIHCNGRNISFSGQILRSFSRSPNSSTWVK